MKAGGRHFEHLLLLKKVSTLMVFELVLNNISVRQFLITSKPSSCHD